MKCTSCNAELPDSATYCNQCGQSVVRGQPAGFTYLPAGTPSWPTSVPQALASSQSAMVTQLTSESNRRNDRPRRSAGSIVRTTALVVLVPVLGILLTLATLTMNGDLFASNHTTTQQSAQLATPTADSQTSAGNQLPAVTSSKAFRDNDLNITLQYPSDWSVDPTQKGQDLTATGLHSQQQFKISMDLIRFTDSGSSQFKNADDASQNLLNSFLSQQGISNIQPVTGTTSQSAGGTNWPQREATFEVNGQKYHVASISTQHGKNYYTIIFYSPDSYYSEAVSKYIQPMLQSFKFLS